MSGLGQRRAFALHADALDVSTLAPSALYHLGWSQVSPAYAPEVVPYAGDSALTGAGGLSWYNAAQCAMPGQHVAYLVTVPAGVTALAVEIDEVQRHPSVGATAALYLEFWTSDGLTRLHRTTVSVGATAANVTTGDVALTAGTEYQVRIASVGSFLLGRVRVRPTAGTDAFWLAPFSRLDPLGALHENGEGFGYYAGQPRYPRQSGFSEIRFDTDASSARVETFTSSVLYLDGTGAPALSRFAVGVAGATGEAWATYAPVSEECSFSTVALGGPNRVTVRAGEAVATGYAASLGPRITAIRAVYFAAGARVNVLRPPPVTIGVVADSKASGAGASSPAFTSIAAFFRARGLGYRLLGWGGGTAAQFAATNALREGSAFALRNCDAVAIQVGRNDLVGNTSTAQSTISGYLSALADVIHARGSSHVILPGVSHEQATNEALDFGSGGATWDDFRDLVRAIAPATGADAQARSPWCFAPDSAALCTVAQSALGIRTADGTHPDTVLQWMVARQYASTVNGGDPVSAYGVMGCAPAAWVSAEAANTPGAMSSLAGTGASPPSLTLTGAPNAALNLLVRVEYAGALGIGQLKWSINGGSKWYHALTAATITLGGTGLTLNCPADNYQSDNAWSSTCTVATAADLSGNGATVTQAVTGSRPPLLLNAINGRAGWNYDGTTVQYLARSGLSLAAYSVFMVAKSTDTGSLRSIIGAPAGGTFVNVYYSATNIYANAAAAQITTTCDMTAPHVIGVVANGASSVLYVDGIATTGTLGAHTASAMAIGYDNGTGNKHKGSISEVIMIDGAVSADEARVITGYLRARYATP